MDVLKNAFKQCYSSYMTDNNVFVMLKSATFLSEANSFIPVVPNLLYVQSRLMGNVLPLPRYQILGYTFMEKILLKY